MTPASPFFGGSIKPGEAHGPVATTAYTARKLIEREHVLQMMRVYVADCSKEKERASIRLTEELNAAISGCVERLAIDRRDRLGASGPSLALDAMTHAIRYVDEHLDANLEWVDGGQETEALAFGCRFSLSPRRTANQSCIGSRLRRTLKQLQGRVMRLADVAHGLGRSCHNHLARLYGPRSGIIRAPSVPGVHTAPVTRR